MVGAMIGYAIGLTLQSASAAGYPDAMMYINLYRSQAHLPLVLYSKRLCKISEVRVQEEKVAFNHDHFTAVISAIPDNPYGMYHENLAKGYLRFGTVMTAWEHSPKHNAVLLGSMTEVCVSHDGNYWALTGFNYMKK